MEVARYQKYLPDRVWSRYLLSAGPIITADIIYDSDSDSESAKKYQAQL